MWFSSGVSNEFSNQSIYSFSIKLLEIFVVIVVVRVVNVYALSLLLHACRNNKAQWTTTIEKKHDSERDGERKRGKHYIKRTLTQIFYLFIWFLHRVSRGCWVFFFQPLLFCFISNNSRIMGMMWRLVCTRHFPIFRRSSWVDWIERWEQHDIV